MRWALAASAVVVVIEALRAAGLPSVSATTTRWLFEAVMVVSAALCFGRAAGRREERAVWALLGGGLALWAVGGIYYWIAVAHLDPQPIASWSDAFSLGLYPLAYAALILLARSRIAGLRGSASLDGAMVGFGATAVLAALLLDDVARAAAASDGAAALAKLAYPIGDLGLLGVTAGVLVVSGGRLGRTWGLIALGTCAFAASDLVWLDGVARGTFVSGTITDIGWYAGPVLLACAAWSRRECVRAATTTWTYALLPVLTGLAAVGLFVYDELPDADVNGVAIGCAAATLVAVTVRLALMLRENAAMIAASDRLAHTDVLTGLANRRQLVMDLEARLGAEGAPARLALFDLNGFKAYNDTFGHLAGDELLARLGRRLQAAVGAGGVAYRMGGDEFCVLVPESGGSGPSALRSMAGALTEKGEGFAVTCAFGIVELPREAATPSDALRAADKRMYADKRSDRVSATMQTSEVLRRALTVRNSELGRHAGRVGMLAREVAHELGLSTAEARDVELAAELHDVGKLAIPDAILTKAGPLTDDERRFIEQHTMIGEHILEGAPTLAKLGPIVRASHERVDGTGYPDGLAGETIPLAARIILACDAYEAMTEARPYRRSVSGPEAVAEMRRCAGSQFDPRVVDGMIRVLERADDEEPPRAAAAAG